MAGGDIDLDRLEDAGEIRQIVLDECRQVTESAANKLETLLRAFEVRALDAAAAEQSGLAVGRG